MGKPVIALPAREGFRRWAASYDRDPNPLLALEERIARPMLGSLMDTRVLDVCAGTGRWMSIARSARANVIGIDISAEMLRCAAAKSGLAGSVVVGNLTRLPFPRASADLAICSFGLSYVASIHGALAELARIARRVMISDMHPDAARAGWTRSFETGAGICSVAHYIHSLDDLNLAAHRAGLILESTVEARFGEPERAIFARAGKSSVFDRVAAIPAIFVNTWVGS